MRRNSALGFFRSTGCFLALSIGLLSFADESFAVDRRWNNGTGSFLFGTAGNWQGGVTPGVLDIAQFGISVPLLPAGAYTVNFNNNATNQALHIEDDQVTFNLNSRTYAVTAATGIVIGNQSNSFSGRLTVTNGTITSSTGSNIDVGAVASRTGTLNVTSGGRITGSPNLNIGRVGAGTLNVDLGGVISTNGATTIGFGTGVTGTATILGTASPGSASLITGALNVGSTGQGTVNVQLGGLLQNSGNARLGTGSLFTGVGTGIVNVMNAGSVWNSFGLLEVGDGGSGEVNVTLGGTVNAAETIIGAAVNLGGEVNVAGVNSKWNNSGTLTVGGSGSGVLNITNQGVVETTDGEIGTASFSTSSGIVNVSGAGSLWNHTLDLAVGRAGFGALNIESGGRVRNRFGLMGVASTGRGEVQVDGIGSAWEISNDLYVGSEGVATLDVTGGATVVSRRGFVALGSGQGAVAIDGIGSLWDIGGDLFVGRSGDGTLNVTAGGKLKSVEATIGNQINIPGTVVVDGVGSVWEYSGDLTPFEIESGVQFEDLIVGQYGDGTLEITNGGKVVGTSPTGVVVNFIGAEAGSIGHVRVDGPGSIWNAGAGGSIAVGYDGDATLEISAGGVVQSNNGAIANGVNSTGHVTVDGEGSLWETASALFVGRNGEATLEITGGGDVQNLSAIINGPSASPSTVIVDGPGSTWNNTGQLQLGFAQSGFNAGSGTLQITNGAEVNVGLGLVANDPGTTGTVLVDGGRWNNSDGFAIGQGGVGTLSIVNGGVVATLQEGGIGQMSGSSGAVTIDGPGSELITGNRLYVGIGGNGTMSVTGGARVTTPAEAALAVSPGTIGLVTVSGAGSRWDIGGQLSVGVAWPNNGGNGTLRIQPGATVHVGSFTEISQGDVVSIEGGRFSTSLIYFPAGGNATANFIWSSGTLEVGLFDGALTVPNGGILAPGRGQVAPASSLGLTQVFGDFTLSAGGVLDIEIGGTQFELGFDCLGAEGAISLAGNLRLNLTDGFIPGPSDTFLILAANNDVIGSFANVANGGRLTTSDGLASFRVNYGPGSSFDPDRVYLSEFQSHLYGDYNNDGAVDAADYTIWRNSAGGDSLTNRGEGITGPVGPADYAVWKTNFGRSFGPGAGSLAAPPAVPEPSTLLLSAWGFLALQFFGRRSPELAP